MSVEITSVNILKTVVNTLILNHKNLGLVMSTLLEIAKGANTVLIKPFIAYFCKKINNLVKYENYTLSNTIIIKKVS